MSAREEADAHGAPSADRLLLRAARHSAGRTAGVFLCASASAAVSLALPAALGHTLDLLLRQQPGARTWLPVCTVLLAAEVLLDAALAFLSGAAGAHSTAWLRSAGVRRLLAAAPDRAARFSPGDVATRMSAHATEAGAAPAAAGQLAASVLAPSGALIALFVIDPWTGLAFTAGLPALALLLRAFARHSSDSVARYQRVQSEIASRLLEALGGARTIAAAGTAGRERERILAPLGELAVQGRRMWRVHGSAVARSGVLMPLLITVVLAVGGAGVGSGRLSVGELLAASRYAALAAGAGAVAGHLGALVRGRAAARRTAELLALEAVRYGRTRLPRGGAGTLELRGVRVERDGRRVLDGVDLLVPGGSTVAVVGRSGAGKSTLAAVAGRLADPDRGEVLLDGVRLDQVEHRELRCEVGYAFERPVLFGCAVGDAVAWGAETVSPARVRAAARAAGADGFLRLLPHGYDTPVGRVPLSGGELQRLGLARAFAHAGRLLVLDDATSSLDTATEREVVRALVRQVRPGTRLIVAHRPSSAARADAVVWLESGRIRAVGGHADLWRNAAYRAVFAGDDPAAGDGALPGDDASPGGGALPGGDSAERRPVP
ncbi:ABC transporter transmembrane domain-containing protein [Streptomyces sp. PR69]|uniref:ABC transporter transmembrane domain-containing protein n=1 Tax=Streptomyces sp. PR69 TaxID=2984950 RepID=UPI00226568DD|nr:ABC transporter ATP-binding protein [Streptomyces sp. PR69]